MSNTHIRNGRTNGISRLMDLCLAAGLQGVPVTLAKRVAGKGIQSRISEFHKVQNTFRFKTRHGKITVHRVENLVFNFNAQHPEQKELSLV